MLRINKHPQVIRDLIDLATYIAEDNLDASDKFLVAAEKTFQQLGKMPGMGKSCNFYNPNLMGIRQQAIKGFKKYLIFYRTSDFDVEIIRVIHSARDIEAILEDD
jgi:toxin ParE1/3/4